jgi:diguanylate cyclase
MNDLQTESLQDNLSSATVMIIDDEPIVIDVVQAFLEEAGYRRFIGVADALKAIDAIKDNKPDVVLLDLLMPGLNGLDILAAVRADPELRFIPVIVLTAASDAATKLKVLELGATDFLAKPVDASELTLRMRNSLAFKAYRDHLAYYDGLTGLPNRKLFQERLALGLRRAKRTQKHCALLHMNLDRFKQINETLGHRVGDALLKQVGIRLNESIRGTDMLSRMIDEKETGWSVSRVGGDEFTVLLPDLDRVESAAIVARRILSVMLGAFDIEGTELYATPSIGISVFPDDAQDGDTLLSNAGVALSHAKQKGRNTFVFYSDEINNSSKEKLKMEMQLRHAVERDELILHYQPKIDVRSGQVVSAEVLVRWNHPELGLVPPGQFIPIAEAAGLIVPIGDWAIRKTCLQLQALHNSGFAHIGASVNVSSPQFREGRVFNVVKDSLKRSGIDPSKLTIEITESVLMENAVEGRVTLQAIRELGVRLALDDFGTGYSSLAYLKMFPIHELKIDRAFIMDLPADDQNAAIAAAIIAMAKGLKIEVTAEGIETAEQLAFLQSQGCDFAQGYLFSKPVPFRDFVNFLRAGNKPKVVSELAHESAAMLSI